MPRTTGKNKSMGIDCFNIGNNETLSVFFAKTLKQHMLDFIAMGLYASKSEFVRDAVKRKVIKTLKEIEIMKKWEEVREFNNSQNEIVKIGNKTHEIVRRLE